MLKTMKPKRDLCERGFMQIETRGHLSPIKTFNLRPMIIAHSAITPNWHNYFFPIFNGQIGNTDELKWRKKPICSNLPYSAYTGFSSIKQPQFIKHSHKHPSTITGWILIDRGRHIAFSGTVETLRLVRWIKMRPK